MCNCQNVCRTPDTETENGRWPLPNHAPVCEDFKQERFVNVIYDGSWCLMEPNDAEEMVSNSVAKDEYEVQDVFLTRDQFEKLPEFEGF